MTLIQLRDRLNAVIAENDRRFASENRNNLPLAVCLKSYPLKSNGKRGYKTRYVAIEHLDAARVGLGDAGSFTCFTACEDTVVWPQPKPRKAVQEVK